MNDAKKAIKIGTQEVLEDMQSGPLTGENAEAFEIITIAMSIEQLAKDMRLGRKQHHAAALQILELMKQLPGVPA